MAWPAAASARQVAAPMPRAPPVTMIRPDIWRSPGWVFDHKRPDEGHVKRRGIYHDIERVLVPTRYVALPRLWRHSWRQRVVRATVAREGDPTWTRPRCLIKNAIWVSHWRRRAC